MNVSILQLASFFLFFGVSFYAFSCIRFEKFCKNSNPQQIYVLLFLLSFMSAWICTQALLMLTVYNGLGR